MMCHIERGGGKIIGFSQFELLHAQLATITQSFEQMRLISTKTHVLKQF